jgi:hypothetical protein
LGEEIVFRGLVQGRLQWVMKPHYAIALSSIVFALMHIAQGESKIVALDLTTIFIDSVIFGILFYKTKNIYILYSTCVGKYSCGVYDYQYVSQRLSIEFIPMFMPMVALQ